MAARMLTGKYADWLVSNVEVSKRQGLGCLYPVHSSGRMNDSSLELHRLPHGGLVGGGFGRVMFLPTFLAEPED